METVDGIQPEVFDTKESELAELASVVRRDLEQRIGFRLSLLSIDVEAQEFKLFHLPSTRPIQIEYADKVAKELYGNYADSILSITREAS